MQRHPPVQYGQAGQPQAAPSYAGNTAPAYYPSPGQPSPWNPPPQYQNAAPPQGYSSNPHMSPTDNNGSWSGNAPTPPGSSSNLPPLNLEPIKLSNTRNEQHTLDNLADFYSIICSVERLEKMYLRDAINAEEYTKACSKLIGQFKTAHEIVRQQVPDVAHFLEQYHVSFPAAVNRLVNIGVPATVYHGGQNNVSDQQGQVYVAETVHHFITTMDSLKLNMTAVDQIHPLVNDLMESLNRVSALDSNHDSKVKIRQWLVTLNRMRASESLDDDQARQLAFDLESAYSAFHKALESK